MSDKQRSQRHGVRMAIQRTLLHRYTVCADAARRYQSQVIDDGALSESYRQMAATERCAAAELGHTMVLLGFDDPRAPVEVDAARRNDVELCSAAAA